MRKRKRTKISFRKSRCLKCRFLTHIFSSVLYFVSGSLLPPKQQHGMFEAKLKVLVRVPQLPLRGPAEAECGGRRSASTVGRRSSAAALLVTMPPEHRSVIKCILPRCKTPPPTHAHTLFFFFSFFYAKMKY